MNLIRTLLGLLIIIIMLPIMTKSFIYTSNIEFNYNEINDELALMQLRELLLLAYDVNINDTSMDFIYKNKNFCLSMINNKLILQPGTQIFLNDIDNLCFKIMDNCIYIDYERDDKTYESIIASKEGVYLNDFSNCDDFDDESDSCQE